MVFARARATSARSRSVECRPLTDPGNQGARIDLLFRERAFWTFGRGQRLGDLRREIRVYNKTAAQVFPGEGGSIRARMRITAPT
jgi:hypothetical protein